MIAARIFSASVIQSRLFIANTSLQISGDTARQWVQPLAGVFMLKGYL